jgi:hypothetical protein
MLNISLAVFTSMFVFFKRLTEDFLSERLMKFFFQDVVGDWVDFLGKD